jgi:hypothetical protein
VTGKYVEDQDRARCSTLPRFLAQSLFPDHAWGSSPIFSSSFFGVVGRDRMTFAIAICAEARHVNALSRQFKAHGVSAGLSQSSSQNLLGGVCSEWRQSDD